MFWEYIGEKKFMQALRTYFVKYQFSNAKKWDLFRELDLITGENISASISPWILKTGYPYIEITQVQEISRPNHFGFVQSFMNVFLQNKTPKEVNITLFQSRFLLSGETDSENNVWFIPLELITNSSTYKYTIDKAKTTITVPIDGDWFIKFNKEGVSLVRVKYTKDLLLRILKNIDALGLNDKTTMISDTIAFLISGRIDAD